MGATFLIYSVFFKECIKDKFICEEIQTIALCTKEKRGSCGK